MLKADREVLKDVIRMAEEKIAEYEARGLYDFAKDYELILERAKVGLNQLKEKGDGVTSGERRN